MLNYPRRDCAALAMEEVKRFLETAEPTMTIEKIIFCVFGSNDDFIYQMLLPVYFPPLDSNINKSLPSRANIGSPSSSTTSETSTPRRTIFGSLGEAFRSVKLGKQPIQETSRPLQPGEEQALLKFESHARDCPTCRTIPELYINGKNLCADGYAAAQFILQYLYMEESQNIYSTHLDSGRRGRVEIPADFTHCWHLLTTLEKSFRDENRSQPFVSPNRPYTATSEEGKVPPGVMISNADVEIPLRSGPEKAYAIVYALAEDREEVFALRSHECAIHIHPGKVELYSKDDNNEETLTPFMHLELTLDSVLTKSESLDVIIDGPIVSQEWMQEDALVRILKFIFRSEDDVQRDILYQKLEHALGNHVSSDVGNHRQQGATESDTRPTNIPYRIGLSNSSQIIATLYTRGEVDHQWQKLYPFECVVGVQSRSLEAYEIGAGNTASSEISPSGQPKRSPSLLDILRPSLPFRESSGLLVEAEKSAQPLFSLDLSPSSLIAEPKPNETDLSVVAQVLQPSRLESGGNIMFRCRRPEDAQALFLAADKARFGRRSLGVQRPSQSEKGQSELPTVPTHEPTTPTRRPEPSPRAAASPPLARSPLPEITVPKSTLALAERMLAFLRSTINSDSGVPYQQIATGLRTSVQNVAHVAKYLEDLDLVQLTADDRVLVKGDLSSIPAGHDGREHMPPSVPTLLAQRILALLKAQPPNSEGLHVQEIAVKLDTEAAEVVRAGEHLLSLGFVHTSVDLSTWTLADISDHTPTVIEKGSSKANVSIGSSGDTTSKLDLSISGLSTINIDDFFTYLDLAPDPERNPSSRSKETPRFDLLGRSAIIDVTNSPFSPWSRSEPTTTAEAPESATDDEDLGMRHPRPTTPDTSQSAPIPPSARWTKIDRRLVNAQALEEVNERFEQREDCVIVLRVVPRGEIMQWAERTREIRRGRQELKEFARIVGSDTGR